MLRIDRSVTPTMAKTPTLAAWELDQLRTIEHVVRLGHVGHVEPGRLVLDDGEVSVAKDAVVVHCAASGLQYPPLVPIWGTEAITLQPVRTGFPVLRCGHRRSRRGHPRRRRARRTGCARRRRTRTRPRLGAHAGARQPGVDGLRGRPRAQGLGERRRSTRRGYPPDLVDSAELGAALQRFRTHVGPGLARMAELAEMS